MVGSGAGAKIGECNEGGDLPVRALSFIASSFTAPTVNMQIEFVIRVAVFEKSSPPMTGFLRITICGRTSLEDAASWRVNRDRCRWPA
jgi:hypothetical protein